MVEIDEVEVDDEVDDKINVLTVIDEIDYVFNDMLDEDQLDIELIVFDDEVDDELDEYDEILHEGLDDEHDELDILLILLEQVRLLHDDEVELDGTEILDELDILLEVDEHDDEVIEVLEHETDVLELVIEHDEVDEDVDELDVNE